MSDFRVGKLETAAPACQCNVERFTIELVDYRFAAALQDARYVNRRGSECEGGLSVDEREPATSAA